MGHQAAAQPGFTLMFRQAKRLVQALHDVLLSIKGTST